MAPTVSGLVWKRRRLAGRLGWQAFLGVAACAALALLLAGLACFGVYRTVEALLDGLWWSAAGRAGLAAIAGFTASRMAGWLFSGVDLPAGILLERQAAPRFRRLIERMVRRFPGVHIDQVWITSDMNAAVLQRPRWGYVGPLETHLLIGLPLVHSVSRRQLWAILAHEFAHLACQRQGWAAWGCHVRSWWFRVLDRCVDDVPQLGGAIDRWSTGFVRRALCLARLEEFEADQGAARVVGARRVGDALIEVALKERFLTEDYWHKVMAQCAVRARPSIRPYREMALGMVAGFRRTLDDERDLAEVTGRRAGPMDMHPSLAQRLKALGVRAEVIEQEQGSAAEHYLAALLPKLALEFDRAWWISTRGDWRRQYRYSRRVAHRRAAPVRMSRAAR